MCSASGKNSSVDGVRNRSVIIGCVVLLMAGAVYIIGESYSSGRVGPTESGRVLEKGRPSILTHEISGFHRADKALAYLTAPWTTSRTLAEFYQRRSYPGGPPYIPHPVVDDRSLGGDACLTCHQDGGFAPKFNAYTPVVPHPELRNCRQCHVPLQSPGELFQNTTFIPAHPPVLAGAALPAGPPPIPHELHMRENCLACHAGAGAVVDIRTTHPERINCRQCHASATGTVMWERPGPGRTSEQ